MDQYLYSSVYSSVSVGVVRVGVGGEGVFLPILKRRSATTRLPR